MYWFYYSTPPVDCWLGWTSLFHTSFGLLQKECSVDLKEIRNAFIALGWKGDGQWRISAVPFPDDCSSRIIVSVKQQDNGTCFFASQAPLPWMEEWLVKTIPLTTAANGMET